MVSHGTSTTSPCSLQASHLQLDFPSGVYPLDGKPLLKAALGNSTSPSKNDSSRQGVPVMFMWRIARLNVHLV